MLKAWSRAIALSLAFVALVGWLIYSSWKALDEQIDMRTEAAAYEVGENLRLLVESHVKVLQTFSQVEHTRSEKEYLRLAQSVTRNYPGFYAVNWIDPDGTIRRVYPLEKNRAALGRLVYDNLAVKDLVEFSAEYKVPVMSPKFMTFQGVEAATLYMPVIQDGKFQGWMNGVLDLQGWFTDYLRRKASPGLSVRIRWSSDPNSIYEFGPAPSLDWSRETQAQILNQSLRIQVSLNHASDARRRWMYGVGAFAAGGVLAVLLTGLVLSLQYSVQQLVRTNRRLALKNALVSSLAHDLSTPLTVLNFSMEKLESEKRFEEKNWSRLKKAGQTLRQMVESVRLMHAAEVGRLALTVKPVPVDPVIQEALEQVQELANRKDVLLVTSVHAKGLQVMAEQATLTYNVLPNVLTNAIKFSRPGGRVLVQVEEREREIVLVIIDEGVGMPEEQLRALRGRGPVTPSEGAGGERGSGLGMLQVKIFMDLYGGRFGIYSRAEATASQPAGTTVSLYFQVPPAEKS